MIQFEKDFVKELEIEYRSVFLWKIELARFYQRNNQYESGRIILLKIFKQLDNKEGLDDVKLELCDASDIGEKSLLKQINESNLEKESDKLKYISIRFFQFLQKRDFAESEKWLNEFEERCIKYDFSYYKADIVFHEVWFLYRKSQFNEARDLLEKLDEFFKQSYNAFYILKSLLFLKLGKYDEAESVYNGKMHLYINDDVCLSFIKFMKNDFSGAKKFLEKWKVDNDINKILDYVCLYEIKWNDFNKKKNSSLFNQNEDIAKSLKKCVEMKKVVVKMYDMYFL